MFPGAGRLTRLFGAVSEKDTREGGLKPRYFLATTMVLIVAVTPSTTSTTTM